MGGRANLVIAGIDEAGYGPRLGPLCCGLAAFEVGAGGGGELPDLWRTLSGPVAKRPSKTSERRRRIYVNDSKLLKGANTRGMEQASRWLELGVRTFLRAWGRACDSDTEVFDSLGMPTARSPWYRGGNGERPRGSGLCHAAELISVYGARLRGELSSAGVVVRGLRCAALDERAFNHRLERLGSKADVAFTLVSVHLATLWSMCGDRPVVCVIDRQGGRTRYASVLGRALPEARTETVQESTQESRYRLTFSGRGPLEVRFVVGGDTAFFPTALASMIAKLVRERAMMRFNEFWGARKPDVRETAGYGADARRWLDEMRSALSRDERETLIRRA